MKKKTKMVKADAPCSIEEDPLVQAIVESKGREIEVIAFGISYSGTLKKVDVENGYIVISDDEDTAVLELERISNFRRIGA
jgi:secreted trypsin-like serine protease